MSDDQEIQEGDVKSLNSHAVSPVRFQNNTGRRVNLIWVDFQGRQRVQFELETEQGINFNTYVTHPWRAEDTESRNGLLLNLYETFYPPNPEVARIDMRQRRALVRRLNVNITTPGVLFVLWHKCCDICLFTGIFCDLCKLFGIENVRTYAILRTYM